MTDPIRQTPPFTELVWDGKEPILAYRSVPGRGTSLHRRIDVSAALDLGVVFERIRPGRGGVERTIMGKFVLDGGVPLLWVVPDDAQMEDVLVTLYPFTPSDDGNPSMLIWIGDHWHTS